MQLESERDAYRPESGATLHASIETPPPGKQPPPVEPPGPKPPPVQPPNPHDPPVQPPGPKEPPVEPPGPEEPPVKPPKEPPPMRVSRCVHCIRVPLESMPGTYARSDQTQKKYSCLSRPLVQ